MDGQILVVFCLDRELTSQSGVIPTADWQLSGIVIIRYNMCEPLQQKRVIA